VGKKNYRRRIDASIEKIVHDRSKGTDDPTMAGTLVLLGSAALYLF